MRLRDKFSYCGIKKALLVGLIIFLICFSFGEIVCRVIFPDFISFVPKEFDENYKLYKSRPGIEGRYVRRGVKNGYFRINNEGWNSTRDYFEKKDPNIFRIATLGGGYTEAIRVNVKHAYPQILENTLLADGINTEVYGFGSDHMPLAQALHVTRYVIDKFHPDIITIYSIGGDFLTKAAQDKYFMSLEIDKSGVVKEIMPVYQVSIFKKIQKFLYHSRFITVVDRSFDISIRSLKLVRKTIAWIQNIHSPSQLELDLRSSQYQKDYEIGLRYLLKQFKNIQERDGVKILFIIGPPWYMASYNLRRPKNVEESKQFLKALLEEFSLPYFDLTKPLAEVDKLNGIKLFLPDGHPNEHFHKVVGEAIANCLMQSEVFEGEKYL